MDGRAAPPPPPPPPPPPHGQTSGKSSGLPPGNYDIFVIPPHSSGSGFLYLPSLQPHRNSFLAGAACTLLVVVIWTIIVPVLRQWTATVVASGGVSVVLLILGVGVAGWAWGKTQIESQGPGPGGGSGASAASSANTGPHQQNQQQSRPSGGAATGAGSPNPKPQTGWQRSASNPNTSAWEKAREETRKREEERRAKEAVEKSREEAEKKAREAAEKFKWETARKREKEAHEREALEKAAREKKAKEAAAASTPNKKYEKPTARSYAGTEASVDAHSFRPYDEPNKHPAPKGSPSSAYSSSRSSYVSQSTARTTPPPSNRGPFKTKDPSKIVIKAVYLFSELFPKPIAQLVSGDGRVSDGLVLRITTEGMFVDDEIRGVGQREWDVKAWTLKLVESATSPNKLLHVLRASIRDPDGKKYVFVLQEEEAWKVAVGLQRLKRGTQVRSLNQSAIPPGELKMLLGGLGWL